MVVQNRKRLARQRALFRYGKELPIHVLLLGGVGLSIFPFYWLLVMATNTSSDIFHFPPRLTFGQELFVNITNVLQSIDFIGSFFNTLLVALSSTILILFFSSIAGFAFAKFSFPGRNALFVTLLATMMLPAHLSVVPSFVIMAHLGWVGSFKALVIPGAVTAFSIFWMRQYAQNAIHQDLIDAARVDGCSYLRMYWVVALPFLRPALAFLGVFTFIHAWNDYMWPLIILTNPQKVTLQVALSQLSGIYNTDYGMVMAGTALATLPLICIFLVGSRQFIGDIAAGALKE
ncbi:carbohydrate ABC transporter permease [Tengunoibacter tsumagoiensis]|uniref:Sugar ABC transporter permease n=1 Tax=Tengunoibacter tsumagoiensis TaxID=2014871 RepID=A0A402A6F7_9CHLR|nr:carbohydrate ABC transporter permease [Tengunoibacter tsumagoiensis]GCE14712.1 sugar ABC transporter permease [Tengunoibacter tsumagoiensis]